MAGVGAGVGTAKLVLAHMCGEHFPGIGVGAGEQCPESGVGANCTNSG